MVPVIETARLRLRGFQERDLEPQAETLRDAEVMRHLGGRPLAREEVWRRMLTGLGLWAMYGYGYWVAEGREDGGEVAARAAPAVQQEKGLALPGTGEGQRCGHELRIPGDGQRTP